MSMVNKTGFLVQHELCTNRFDESEWDSKLRRNHEERWCECTELHGCSSCKDVKIWSPETKKCSKNFQKMLHLFELAIYSCFFLW